MLSEALTARCLAALVSVGALASSSAWAQQTVTLPPSAVITTQQAQELVAAGWQQAPNGFIYKDLNADGTIDPAVEVRAVPGFLNE